MEVSIDSLEKMCDPMCDNRIPWDGVKIGKKNLVERDPEWLKDDSILCFSCKYATWGWEYTKYFKRRFVRGCVKPLNDRGNHITVSGFTGPDFCPAISCEAYKEVIDGGDTTGKG